MTWLKKYAIIEEEVLEMYKNFSKLKKKKEKIAKSSKKKCFPLDKKKKM